MLQWRQFTAFGLMVFLLLGSGCTMVSTASTERTAIPSPPPTVDVAATATTTACALTSNQPPAKVNVQVTYDTFMAHSEPMFASNPMNPLNLVGGAKLFPGLDRRVFQVGYFASFDGGCTWLNGGPLPGYAPGQIGAFGSSNVSMAFGRHNDVHAIVVYHRGIGISTSLDGGRTFGMPVFALPTDQTTDIGDKPWIAVDNSTGPHQGTIYATWTNVVCNPTTNHCANELGFARSTDLGKTFSAPRLIEGTAPFCTIAVPGRPAHSILCDAVAGIIPMVASDGTVVVIFQYFDANAVLPTRLLAISSRDGGQTWTHPAIIATLDELPADFSGESYSISSLPSAASDPASSHLYVTWSDYATGDADVLLTTSTNDGSTWSAPVRVNDDPLRDGAEQFAPQVAVAPNEVVSVTFYDTRRDPQGHLIDEYLAQSVNHGARFLPNVRVSSANWEPILGAPVQADGQHALGDYEGLAVDDHFVHPFWTDAQTGTQQIFTAALPSAQP